LSPTTISASSSIAVAAPKKRCPTIARPSASGPAIATAKSNYAQAIFAKAEFRLAIDADPNLARAHIGLGVALAQSGDLSGAKKALRDALRIDPANAEAKYDLELIEKAGRR
jgi:Flp pilus assembly protein TadD